MNIQKIIGTAFLIMVSSVNTNFFENIVNNAVGSQATCDPVAGENAA